MTESLQVSRSSPDKSLPIDMVPMQGVMQENTTVHFNVFVKKQINSANIIGSNIEKFGVSQNIPGSSSTVDGSNYSQDMIADKNPEDCTWLSHKVVMFNNGRISRQPNSRVYHGRQEIFRGRFRDVAIKLIEYSEKNMKELDVILKLNHPNIVQIYDAGEHRGAGHWIYIVMELCSMNLEDYVKKSPSDPTKAFLFFKQIIAAVDFMHERNIAHRDIKPTNILISQCGNVIKFSDFGISKEIPHGFTSVTDTSPGAGSEGYKPPELYNDDYKVTLRSDIFSLGIVTTYLFSHGKHPFGDKPFDWGYRIRNNKNIDLSQIPSGTKNRQELVKMLKKMLRHKPRDRPAIHQVKDVIFSERVDEDTGSNSGTATGVDKEAASKSVRSIKTGLKAERNRRLTLKEIHIDREPKIVLFDNTSKHLCCFDHRNESITKMQKYAEDFLGVKFSAVSFGEYIYVFDTKHSYRLEYRKLEARWERLDDWNYDIAGEAPVVVSSPDAIFFVGERDSRKATKAIVKYDPRGEFFERLLDKPTATCWSALLCNDNFLYCIGGFDSSENPLHLVERMDLNTMKWTRVSNMNQSRYGACCVEHRGNLFVVDDEEHLSMYYVELQIEMYNPKVDQWIKLNSIDVDYMTQLWRAFVVDDSILAVCERHIYKYDFHSDEWDMIRPTLYRDIIAVQASLVNLAPIGLG